MSEALRVMAVSSVTVLFNIGLLVAEKAVLVYVDMNAMVDDDDSTHASKIWRVQCMAILLLFLLSFIDGERLEQIGRVRGGRNL